MDYIKDSLPIYYFHPDETNFPDNFNYFISNSNLVKNGVTKYSNLICNCGESVHISKKEPILETISGDIILNKGEISLNTQFIEEIGKGEDTYLDYKGNLTNSLSCDAPIYYNTILSSSYIDIYLHLFYNYQPSYSLNICYSNLFVGGDHQADIETIKYRIDTKTNKIIHIGYYQHGKEHIYFQKDLLWVNDRPVVFISKDSHASYPKGGKYKRLFGFANDICSNIDNGIQWKSKNYINLNKMDDNNFIKWYQGGYGNSKITSFAKRI